MARGFRLWGKKRGKRRTGSPRLGGVGEALFYAALLLLGTVALAGLGTSHALGPEASPLSGWVLFLSLLIALSFILIGGGGVFYSVIHVGASAERRSAIVRKAVDLELLRQSPARPPLPNVPRDTNLTNSPGVKLRYRLPMSQASSWKLFGAAAFWLAALGIASMLVVWAFDGDGWSTLQLRLAMVAGPFVVIALVATGCFFRQLLVYTSLGPTHVEISDHPLLPGRTYRVLLSQAGRLAMNRLELKLVCEEEATYRQGTEIRTETAVVYEQPVFCQEQFRINPGIPYEHESALQVPPEAMHSFRAPSNAVHWKLIVRGEPAGWPAFQRCFPVIVHPGSRN